jgi:hypothetical protein
VVVHHYKHLTSHTPTPAHTRTHSHALIHTSASSARVASPSVLACGRISSTNASAVDACSNCRAASTSVVSTRSSASQRDVGDVVAGVLVATPAAAALDVIGARTPRGESGSATGICAHTRMS